MTSITFGDNKWQGNEEYWAAISYPDRSHPIEVFGDVAEKVQQYVKETWVDGDS